MKKFLPAIALLLTLSLAACSNQDTPPADSDDTAPSESITILDEGVWPKNSYTEGLPVPPGTVKWAMLDTEQGNCAIHLVNISETEYGQYMELLKQEGFSVVEEVSEKIAGQSYVSIGTLLSNNEKGLSISYVPGNFSIYISLVE